MYNFDPYYIFLVIATNIPHRLKTGFVLQGHTYKEENWPGNGCILLQAHYPLCILVIKHAGEAAGKHLT